jgi:hypothetical protein
MVTARLRACRTTHYLPNIILHERALRLRKRQQPHHHPYNRCAPSCARPPTCATLARAPCRSTQTRPPPWHPLQSRKIFNCIVDDTALVAGVKKSTRNGIRQWVKNGQIRLFVPLHGMHDRVTNEPASPRTLIDYKPSNSSVVKRAQAIATGRTYAIRWTGWTMPLQNIPTLLPCRVPRRPTKNGPR